MAFGYLLNGVVLRKSGTKVRMSAKPIFEFLMSAEIFTGDDCRTVDEADYRCDGRKCCSVMAKVVFYVVRDFNKRILQRLMGDFYAV